MPSPVAVRDGDGDSTSGPRAPLTDSGGRATSGAGVADVRTDPSGAGGVFAPPPGGTCVITSGPPRAPLTGSSERATSGASVADVRTDPSGAGGAFAPAPGGTCVGGASGPAGARMDAACPGSSRNPVGLTPPCSPANARPPVAAVAPGVGAGVAGPDCEAALGFPPKGVGWVPMESGATLRFPPSGVGWVPRGSGTTLLGGFIASGSGAGVPPSKRDPGAVTVVGAGDPPRLTAGAARAPGGGAASNADT